MSQWTHTVQWQRKSLNRMCENETALALFAEDDTALEKPYNKLHKYIK